MKKVLFLLTSFCFFASSFAAFEVKPVTKKASEILLPIGNKMQISLEDLSVINVKDFEKITGKHLNFIDQMEFKIAQKKLRKSINADGTINNKKLEKFMADVDHSSGFHLGGFALGFFIGLIGVLIAYLIGGDQAVKKNRTKWAWLGFLSAVVLGIIFALLL